MNPARRREGIKRAGRVLAVWRAREWPGFPDWEAAARRMLISGKLPCSCPMCGNQRRHFGQLTVQERRADEVMAMQMQEAAL